MKAFDRNAWKVWCGIVLVAGFGAIAGSGVRRVSGEAASPASAGLEMFGAGVISTPDDEAGIAVTPDGRTAYFGKLSRTTTTTPVSVICVSHFAHGRWGRPEIAPFSGVWHDLFPALSPDGAHLVFTSDRPRNAEPARSDPDVLDTHLWMVDRTAAGWGPPRPLGPPIESADTHEQGASLAADGTLYFSSDRPEGKGRMRLFRARRTDGGFSAPQALSSLNGPGWESQPAVTPDQGLLVFASGGRPDTSTGGGARYPRADLYASVRIGDGWSAPRHLGAPINSDADEGAPSFSADGETFYFTSERGFISVPMPHPLSAGELAAGLASTLNGGGNLYRLAARVVRDAASAGGPGAPAPPPATAPAPGPAPATATAPAPAPTPATASLAGAEELRTATPRLFGQGALSTPDDEFGGQLMPDGKSILFSRSVPRFYFDTIFESHRVAGGWSAATVAPFSGQWRDYDPVLSADGSQVFFISDRPAAGLPAKHYNVWTVQRRPGGGWSEPRALAAPINGTGDAHFACTTLDGTLYFTSHRPGNLGYVDVWRSRRVEGTYAAPENLGPSINGPDWTNLEAYVTPRGDEMIVAAFGHADGYGDADLFVSYLRDGAWTPLRNLGPRINSAARDYSPRLGADGRTLLFTSERGLPNAPHGHPLQLGELEKAMHSILNGLGNLYVVRLDAPPPAAPQLRTQPAPPRDR